MSNSTIDVERRRLRAEVARGALERRTFGEELEVREVDGGSTLTFSGDAAVYRPHYSMGDYDETVDPNALTRCLSEQPDCIFNANHGKSLSGLPMARTLSRKGGPGTLTLTSDAHAFRYVARVSAEDPDAQALARAIRAGNMSQCSMAFRCQQDSWNADMTLRTLKVISVHGGDVSCVAFGASPTTTVSVRALSLAAGAGRRPLGPSRAQLDRERLFLVKAGRARTIGLTARASDPRSQIDRIRLERLRQEAK